MNGLLPRSLFGQTLLILVAGLIVSHARWIMDLPRTANRPCAQSADFPPHNASQISRNWCRKLHASGGTDCSGLNDQTFQVSLSAQAPALIPDDQEGAVAWRLRNFLSISFRGAGPTTSRICIGAGRAPPSRPTSDDGARPDDARMPASVIRRLP